MCPTRSALVIVMAAVAHAAAAAGQELGYSGSIQFSSGRYIFTEPTRTLSLYNGLTFTAGPLRLSASLPVIVQNSGAVTVVGGTYLPTGGSDAGAVGGRRQGEQVPMGHGGGPNRSLVELSPGTPSLALGSTGVLEADVAAEATDSTVAAPGSYTANIGDPYVSGAVTLYRGWGALRSLELTGSVKVPANDLDSGVGTGEWDYAVGGAAAGALGRVLVFVDVAWWWFGDLDGLELRDGVGWGGGLGLPLSDRLWASAMATATNRVIESAEAARSVSAGLSYRLGGAGTVSVNAGLGLTETSPDYTLSLGWRRSLLSRP